MPTRIDMSTYTRRAHFEYFLNLGYPYVGNTVEVDATPLYAKAKERAERNGTTEADERKKILATYERSASNAKKRNKR